MHTTEKITLISPEKYAKDGCDHVVLNLSDDQQKIVLQYTNKFDGTVETQEFDYKEFLNDLMKANGLK